MARGLPSCARMFMRRGGATIFDELIAQRAARVMSGLSAARSRKELVSPSATPIGMRATREMKRALASRSMGLKDECQGPAVHAATVVPLSGLGAEELSEGLTATDE